MPGVPDVSPPQAFQALQDDPQAVLVDVRTDAEWNFVGVPDLGAIGKQLRALEQWLGTPLFEEDARDPPMTAAGRRLARTANGPPAWRSA